MLRFRSLGQRFGALYALVIALLLGVSTVVTIHLYGIRLDSERLLEEAREQAIMAQMLTSIDALEALLARPDDVDPDELERARGLLRSAREELVEFLESSDDPSRPEHQEAEDRISDRLEQDLLHVDELLATGPPESAGPATADLLARAGHYAHVLLAEAREEAVEANHDLRSRTRATGLILIATWAAAVLILGLAQVLIHRGVVRPLGALRSGTERFGRGDREHRIDVGEGGEGGEIADLARSFNAMADRLARAQSDLEERVRLRTLQFIRAARLADLGLLASGIAHEINTPLASIASSAEGLQRRARNGSVPGELLDEYVRVISDEAFRAREITTRMLALARQEPSELSRVPLRPIVEQALSALRHRAEQKRVRLAGSTVPEDAAVVVNAGELVQVLVNLLANAIDASGEGGRVELRARVADGRLALEVEDEGEGIPAEAVDRIFDPFYSTKSPGSGTGLGLALVATMVEFHGGDVSVQSEPGRGSTFRIDLPADWEAAS